VIQINDLRRHHATLRGELTSAVARVVDSGRFVLGEEVEAFEAEFADACGTPHCVALANGTDALEFALRAVGVGFGDEVITVANAGGYSTTAILALGAVPRFAEIDPVKLLIDPATVPPLFSRRTKAVAVTHLYGRSALVDEVVGLADAAGVPVVEDCAQAHGAVYGGRSVGSWGSIGCYSFYPTKNLGALGDGGAIVTRDPGLADAIRQLRQYGWRDKYHATLPGGRNSRLDELQAAVLRVKLPHLSEWNTRRSEIARAYNSGLSHPKVFTFPGGEEEYVVHLYVVRCGNRESLQAHLKMHGVGTGIHYPVPDHHQTSLGGRFDHISLPVTEEACREVLTLPCFPEMTSTEVSQVISAVNEWRP
jgi:dTDP-4-amino-4,6-dideoxygalactose transaminase